MRPMVYEDSKFPMTLKQLHAIELTCEAKLPADVRDYLISLPGIWPSRNTIGFGGQTFTDFGLPWLWEGDFVIRSEQSRCYILAGARRNALFGIELSDNDYGAMYLCEKERGTPGKRLERVADNLFALLDMLEEDPKTDFWDFYKKCRYEDAPEWLLDTYRKYEEYLPTDEERMKLSDPSQFTGLELTGSGPSVSQEYFDWVELAFRIRIPLDLKKFYSQSNGGHPKKKLFVSTYGFHVNLTFYSWEHPRQDETIARPNGEFHDFTKNLKYERKVLPAQMWPLAYVDEGRELAFSTGKNEYGSIWIVYVDPPQPPVKVADSFSEYVSGVWELPSDDQLYDLPGSERG